MEKFADSFIYNKSGSKIFFQSDNVYVNNLPYRIQTIATGDNDTSEIYSMDLNSGIVNKLTNNGNFDGLISKGESFGSASINQLKQKSRENIIKFFSERKKYYEKMKNDSIKKRK